MSSTAEASAVALQIEPALLARYDVPAPRYTSYPTAPEWTENFGPGDAEAALRRAAAQVDEPLSIYVHVPFCAELCRFCGCNVIASRDRSRGDAYVEHLQAELRLMSALLGERRKVTRLHLGGGTPTWLTVSQLRRLWDGLASAFAVQPGAELAVEVDPVITTPEHLELLAGFGFSRLSIGVQDFEPGVQWAVGREQSVEVTRGVAERARALGFKSINFDLIYGLPFQNRGSWRRTLATVAELAPDRVAAFSFAYVPEQRANQRMLPSGALPTPEEKLQLLLDVHAQLTETGMRAIGIDHFARVDDELARAAAGGTLARDFQGYTTVRAPETLGLGLSSISFIGGAYFQNAKLMSAYREAVTAGLLPAERGHRLSDDDARRRRVIMELMCNFRVELGSEISTLAPEERTDLERLVEDGIITLEGDVLTVTPAGRFFTRVVAMVFDRYTRSRSGEPRRFSRSI